MIKTKERTILHCDLNGFFASVECIFNPALKNVPMAVAGNPENRHGIILAKNELAKAYNIKTAETIWQAKQKCPDLVLVPPRHGIYSKYSRAVNEIYQEFTDMVEPFGIDESWLDVTGVLHLFGSGEEIANKLREEVKRRLDLTISVGVSFNKVFAKLGSDYKKPDATTVISKENYKDITFSLPVTELLYVGRKSAVYLEKIGIRTIGDLANSNRSILQRKLGKQGELIWDYANGLDNSPVLTMDTRQDVKSVGNGWTFKRNLQGYEDIAAGINALSDEVGYRLRKKGLKCTTVSISIKDPDFVTKSRQRSLKYATNISAVIGKVALELVLENWELKNPIRLLSVTAMNLVDKDSAPVQLSLFDTETDNKENNKMEKLENTMDKLREKYGKHKVSIGGAGKKWELGVSPFEHEE